MREKILNSLRRHYKLIKGFNKYPSLSNDLQNIDGLELNEFIDTAIKENKPLMISRFGSEELKWYLNIQSSQKSAFKRYLDYIMFKTDTYFKRELEVINNLTFLPNKSISRSLYFYKSYDIAIKNIDILGTWMYQERYVKFKKNTKFIQLFNLEPYKNEFPWSRLIKSKKVLIIHPMVELIEKQNKIKELIFDFPLWNDETEFLYLKAKYFDDPEYNSWDKMYHYYLDEVSKYNFDIAIIGNGSWGLPLASHIKDMGKIAIHLGGATQILFGIYGNRWLNWPEYRQLMNTNWISGSESEKKEWSHNYENNCYW